MDLGLRDKVIMVAASSKGLGFGIASALAAEGAKLSLASRSAENIEAAAAELRRSFNSNARGYTFEATKAESINDWYRRSLEDFGTIDGLVVNAGGPPQGNFDSFDDAAWTRAYELTLLSAVRMIRAVLPVMQHKGSGSIVTVTSTSVKEPIDGLLLSNVFRSGVASLAKSLANELAGTGIRINNLIPGRIDTERVKLIDETNAKKRGFTVAEQRASQQAAIPMGRYGLPSEFGAAAVFLLSDAASYVTGSTLIVDGGKAKGVW